MRNRAAILSSTLIGLFLALLFAVSNSALADTVDIYGTALPVDEFSDLDDQNVKLKVFGQTRILQRNAAEEFVLQAYLENADSANAIGAEAWKRIFSAAVDKQDIKKAAKAYLLFARSLADSEDMQLDYMEAILYGESYPSGLAREVLKHKSFDILPPAYRSLIFLALGIEELNWLRSNALTKVMQLGDEFRQYCEKQFTQALKVKNVGLARKISRVLEALYLSRRDRYKKFNLVINLVESLADSELSFSDNTILTLVSLRNTNEELRAMLDPIIIETFNSLASSALDKGNAEEALIILSSLNPDQATPTTLSLLSQVFSRIDPASKILFNQSVENMVLDSRTRSEELRLQIDNLFERRVKKLLEHFEIAEANRSFDLYSGLTDDTSVLDEIRVEFALAYLRTGRKKEAGDVLNLHNGSISLHDHGRLFLDGYYGNPLTYVLIILVPLTLKLVYEFIFRAVDKQHTKAAFENYANQAESDPVFQKNAGMTGGGGGFVTMRKQASPLYDEYLDCLKIFDLSVGVDLKGIKMAYRNAVRKIHPDLNANQQSPEHAAQFVELTKTYDRLRELHKLLGL